MTYFNNNYNFSKKNINFLTIYDFIHEKFPHYYNESFRNFALKNKENAIKKADHIICISENTKKDLLKYYKINEKKVSSIHLGVVQNTKKQSLIKNGKNLFFMLVKEVDTKISKSYFKVYSISNYYMKISI